MGTDVAPQGPWLERLQCGWAPLPDKAQETPESTLEALTAASGGEPLEQLVIRRLSGEPLAYLTGRQSFLGIELGVGPGAMIPRKETEILGEAALGCLRGIVEEQGGATVLDVCTGCGNLVLALASHEVRCQGWGSDISHSAITQARRNGERLGLEGRVAFVVGDFLEPFRGHPVFGHADLVVCNPPYISAGKVGEMAREILAYEPREAFDGGAFGITFLLRLVREAHLAVRPGGWVACEAGLGQGESLCRMFSRDGHCSRVEGVPDARGQIRAVLARTHGPLCADRPT